MNARIPWFAVLLFSVLASPVKAQQEAPVRMSKYSLVILRTNSTQPSADSATLTRIRAGHMNNIRRMGEEGKLLTAGPVGGADGVQGIFIFAAGLSKEEVEVLLQRDPAIAEGFLIPDIWEWYSPEGLKVVAPAGG